MIEFLMQMPTADRHDDSCWAPNSPTFMRGVMARSEMRHPPIVNGQKARRRTWRAFAPLEITD
jgi:hypothetical protein